MSAEIRSDITMAPGAALPRNADYTADLVGDAVVEGTPSVQARRVRGVGTLSVSAIAKDGKKVSWLSTLSSDAAAGSVFIVLATAASGSGRYPVAERVVVVG